MKEKKRNGWTPIRVSEGVLSEFTATMGVYGLTGMKYYNIISLYMDKFYGDYELSFIKYYLQEIAAIDERRKGEWHKTRDANLAGRKRRRRKSDFRINVHKKAVYEIIEGLSKSFAGCGIKFQVSVALSFFAKHAGEILDVLDFQKGTDNEYPGT